MALFGLRENMVWIGAAGFCFFAMLPFANTCLDCLIRGNIDNKIQGRVWGLVGLISQLGYVAAYAVSGVLADYLMTPLLLPGGKLAGECGEDTRNRRRQGNRIADNTVRTAALCDSGPSSRYKIYSSAGKQRCI